MVKLPQELVHYKYSPNNAIYPPNLPAEHIVADTADKVSCVLQVMSSSAVIVSLVLLLSANTKYIVAGTESE